MVPAWLSPSADASSAQEKGIVVPLPDILDRMIPTEDDSGIESAYSSGGVELTLIRWMLSLTPAERLETAQQYVDFVVKAHGQDSQASFPDFDELFDLETLIAVKEEVGSEKDLAALPILRRTLEESRRR